MRYLTVRILSATLTFIIGVATASFWVGRRPPGVGPVCYKYEIPTVPQDDVAKKDPGKPEFVGIVPIARLVANPEEFHGKRIQVIGYVQLEFEGNGIYASQEDHKYSLTWNGLWLEIPTSGMEKFTQYNNSYVAMEGIFNAKARGHVGG